MIAGARSADLRLLTQRMQVHENTAWSAQLARVAARASGRVLKRAKPPGDSSYASASAVFRMLLSSSSHLNEC
jgi:hypothetical protein